MDQITFVCVLGIGTVFVGLICIVILCSLVSFLCKKLLSDKKDAVSANEVAPAHVAAAAPAPAAPIADRKKILAAVCAVIAEENGCEVNAIRVLSFKKI
jgi:Na+-transporting methylmalonyl-CoA/oxaloacetate decarboxylase gamma subunit